MSIDLIIVLVSFLIALFAQMLITFTYSKYKQVRANNGLTGFEVARIILDRNGLSNVHIVEVRGYLSDHYDPRSKVVRLSSDIYHGDSLASVAVAAHECGHAIQDKENYTFLRIRSLIAPGVSVASKLSYFAILIGLFFGAFKLIYFGVAALLFILLFEIITLPVEFNASSRAKKELINEGIVDNKEIRGSASVLNAAALTYVASVLTTVLQIFRLLLIANSRKRD